MLILVIRIPMKANATKSVPDEEICINAPMIMMLLTAFVTLIRGVCRAAVTFQITI